MTFEEDGIVVADGNYTVKYYRSEMLTHYYYIPMTNARLIGGDSFPPIFDNQINIFPYQNKNTINIKFYINGNEYTATLTWDSDAEYYSAEHSILSTYINSNTEGKSYNIKIIILP